MPNPLFNRFGNMRNSTYYNQNNSNNNLLNQFLQLKNNPGMILDILFQNGKISQAQYNDLYPYRNSPESIYRYLVNNGNGNEINQIENYAKQMCNK